ncbi:serine/arginine repetitive matrix protein 1 [Ophiocordyceps sinensis CO18]|uniref:Serine/arginine repetitive matrix protein 1 n=1 Tax=Ophiocordyceps sinensis (strain Co18 / CGMCC 3.14243) TaxID=911162 RepID=T5AQP8_OPHSC|nr:serine/arginine repetitive matrix protein 1 [Ophiocordyceps sinensis CO18]
MTSRPASERASPRPSSVRVRSPQPSREDPVHPGATPASTSTRHVTRAGPNDPTSTLAKSPPRGPAALRMPPTGPASNRGVNASIPSPAPSTSRHPQAAGAAAPHRSDATSPTIPPSGPRGYVPPSRGAYGSRSVRGGWSQPPSRQMSGVSPLSTSGGPSPIPTGPRSASTNIPFSSTAPQQRPFNPPTGPSAPHGFGQRQSLAQNLLATMPPIVPGGKLDPPMTPLTLGVTRDLEPHYRKLRDEEEKLRDELRAKQEKLRKSLYVWDKLERDSRAWELRSDLSERSMKNLAGEGMGGAAF